MSQVVEALASGTVSSVQNDFTPDGVRQLQDRRRVDAAHDDLARLGKFQQVFPVPGASPTATPAYRREAFTAVFEHGTRTVDVTFDTAGKIAALWLHNGNEATAPAPR